METAANFFVFDLTTCSVSLVRFSFERKVNVCLSFEATRTDTGRNKSENNAKQFHRYEDIQARISKLEHWTESHRKLKPLPQACFPRRHETYHDFQTQFGKDKFSFDSNTNKETFLTWRLYNILPVTHKAFLQNTKKIKREKGTVYDSSSNTLTVLLTCPRLVAALLGVHLLVTGHGLCWMIWVTNNRKARWSHSHFFISMQLRLVHRVLNPKRNQFLTDCFRRDAQRLTPASPEKPSTRGLQSVVLKVHNVQICQKRNRPTSTKRLVLFLIWLENIRKCIQIWQQGKVWHFTRNFQHSVKTFQASTRIG